MFFKFALSNGSTAVAADKEILNSLRGEAPPKAELLREFCFMAYSDLLKHPKWQQKRLEILQRDNWQCRACCSNEKTLHVHHLKYSNYPWEVGDEYLMTLCSDCHEKEEILRKDFDRLFKLLCANRSVLISDWVNLFNEIIDASELDEAKNLKDYLKRITPLIKKL